MAKSDRVTISIQPIEGSEPDPFEVTFLGADGSESRGKGFDLPAGKVGTWELKITAAEEVRVGGGFLFQRRGFLLGHRMQDDNPKGRDYVTLDCECAAGLNLIVNTADQSHKPGFAQVVVSGGSLFPGDSFTVRVGDRGEGGPGSEVYDATTLARLVAAVDRDGSGVYRALSASPVRVRIRSEPRPDMLRVLGPSIVTPEEDFSINLVVFDPHRNVCEQYEGRVRISAPDGVDGLPDEVAFAPEHQGIRILDGVRVSTPGVYRIEVRDRQNSLHAFSNPVVCRESPDRRLLWGDLHCHSWGDAGMALMDEPNFKLHPASRHEQARRVGRLDFAAPGPMAPPDQEDLPELWQAFQEAYEDNNEPGRYVPYLAAEVHARPGGDRFVIYKAGQEGYLPTRSSMDKLQETYADREDVILEAHVGGGPPDWEAYATSKERLLEVASGHGSFEWVLQRALRHGYRPAVIGSTDAHLPSLGAPMAAHCFRGRFNKVLNIRDTGFGSGPVAAIYAERVERGAIWQAIDERRTFATTGARIVLDVAVNGHRAGSEAEIIGEATVTIKANACAPVERVDLIRNDRCLKSWHPDALDIDLSYTDERPLTEGAYYVRLRQKDGEYAWSTPVWTRNPGGSGSPDDALPPWNAHEPVDLSSLRPNDAEAHEADLLRYLETEESPDRFSEITPACLLDEVTGRSAFFYAYLEPQHIPVTIRWYYEFDMPRIHGDWGWRDFGMRTEPR